MYSKFGKEKIRFFPNNKSGAKLANSNCMFFWPGFFVVI